MSFNSQSVDLFSSEGSFKSSSSKSSRNRMYKRRKQLISKFGTSSHEIRSFAVRMENDYIGFKVVERSQAVCVSEPQERTRLREGDVILQINQHRIEDVTTAKDLLLCAQPGSKWVIFVKRQRGRNDTNDGDSVQSLSISEYCQKKEIEVNLQAEIDMAARPEPQIPSPPTQVDTTCQESPSLPDLLHMDAPRELMAVIHSKTIELRTAEREVERVTVENKILKDKVRNYTASLKIIKDKCSILQPPLRYKYHPKIFK